MDDSINLTEEDYENLRKLFFITKKIKWAYDNLAILEINNKKDTEEYIKWTNYLQILLKIEEQIYKIIGNNTKKISDMLYYILAYEPYNITDVLIYLNNDSEKEILKSRVAAHLDYLINTVPFDDDEMDEFEEYEKVFDDEKIKKLEADFFLSNKGRFNDGTRYY